MSNYQRLLDRTSYTIIHIHDLVGGFKHEFYLPFHIWDVIPTPLTFTPSFFKMGTLHHQLDYFYFFTIIIFIAININHY